VIARLAWHELRQQLGGRVFWIVFAVSVLMVAGAMAIDTLRVGLPEAGGRTGAAAILRTHLVWSLFFLFTAAALVGEAVLRDRLHGFADLVRATPVHRAGYALGRFAGAVAAVLLCFGSVPVALAVSGALLGHGSGPAGSYLLGFLVLAVPNLLLACALFFALAGITRSMTGCLLGAAGLLTLYGLVGEHGGLALVEPFGFAAVAAATQGWSAVQRDTDWPAIAGVLLANRLLWLGLAAVLVVLGAWLAARDRPRRRVRAMRMGEAEAAPAVETRPAPRVEAGWRIVAAQLWVRTAFEARRAVGTPAFLALLIMGLAAAGAAAAKVAGTPQTIASLTTAFQLVPVVVVLFFAGELFWAEREHGIAPIVAVTPANQAVLVLAKLLALALLLFALAVASAGAGVATEIVRGGAPEPGRYLAWYVLPRTFDWLLLGALALFLQSLAPNKLAGWGFLVFYLIGSLALNRLGLQDPMYRFGGYPGAPLPPGLSGAEGVGWYRLGWGMVAAGMVAVACGRGVPKERTV
jgi:ABC-type transport system involved in multi-copper enzyme maturation permease subunit